MGREEPLSTVAALLVGRAGDHHEGIRDADGNGSWTWDDVVREAAVRAAVLSSLRRTDRPFHVGVLLENVPEYVFLLGGAALAGATIVGINPTRRGDELAADIRHSDCAVVLTDTGQAPVLDGLDLRCPVLTVDGEAWAGLLAEHAGAVVPATRPLPDDLFLLIFTSGSTGAPKAVKMSQGRAARTAMGSGVAFSSDDVLYCAMPLFHGNALLANLLPGFVTGATVVLKRRFSASTFATDIRRHGCTYFNYVGRALSYILGVPEAPDDADNRLKFGLGSEASPRDIKEFRRRFGCPVFEGYGSSEGAIVLQRGPGMPPGALGRPGPDEDVAVLDPESGEECPPARFGDDGQLLNAGEAIGEIVGRSGLKAFEGYYANPEAEAERSRRGWYWSGDLGYRDAEGVFYFAGRNADWLRVDGENFSAAPVERILGRFPGVAAVAVYAVPDPRTGDQVMAALELDASATFDPDAFAAFLAAQSDLGTKWAPRFVRVTNALPATATGKTDKQPLRRDRWSTDDDVWWRPVGETSYRRFGPADAALLEQAFADAGRAHVLQL